MAEARGAELRVALLADAAAAADFRSLLESEGVIVIDAGHDEDVRGDADVLLVDVDSEASRAMLDAVLSNATLPVLLNEGGVGHGEIWHQRLLAKLFRLAGRQDAADEAAGLAPQLHVINRGAADGGSGPVYVVVLGASLGGPKALARFLKALPPELPVAFLLVQHMAEEFQEMLSEQLRRCSPYRLGLLEDEQALSAGAIWVVPADSRITLERHGVVRCLESGWRAGFRPSIDAVLEETAAVYGAQCGAILFSGIGDDGVSGCELVARQGGFVWAQSAESCVMAGLPDAVRRAGYVAFNGSPEELAQELRRQCAAAGQPYC